jgi:primosomal protein N' (replication factor Y)
MFAEVAVNVPSVTGVYTYHVPEALAGSVVPGCLVTVSFGAQTVQGVVLNLAGTSPVAETKPVLDLLDPLPVLTAPQLELARQLADSTLSPLAAIIGLMLPPGLSRQADTLYALRVDSPHALPPNSQNLGGAKGELSRTASRIVALLSERGALRGRQIDRHFRNVDWRKSAQWLARRGILDSRSVLPPPSVRPKLIRTAQLAVTPNEAETAMPSVGRTQATLQRRQAALRCLIREPEPVNVAWVYAESGCNLADLQELAERELILLSETEIWRDPLTKVKERDRAGNLPIDDAPLELTAEQQSAWTQILSAFSPPVGRAAAPILLHGVTGSGKTELYIRAASEAIRHGRAAIILVPEIALTPQTVRRFLRRFPGQVGLMHSRLSDGERYDTWRRARSGLIKVLIGPRSALFAPLPEVGLVVLDECHDSSYYQSEPPFYNAVGAAREYAVLCGAVCLLGSATPSVTQRYEAEGHGQLRLAEMMERVRSHSSGTGGLAPVTVVDMREELKTGHRGIFSRLLVDSLAQVLARREQAILFMNRRGTATYVFCRNCGHVLKCPRCDTPLTFHAHPLTRASLMASSEEPGSPTTGNTGNARDLLCHRCGYATRKPKQCPACGSTQIREYGLGSERVEAEVHELFPHATTLRWDFDTTREKDAHDIILSHFVAHRADVLVGTQMLAKGLDLPLVTLVGIVLADAGLALPDPFAGERAFQTLTQVAGRAGRSTLGGQVVLQTFDPDNPVIQAAAAQDYQAFYGRELAARRELGYPPFTRLVRLEFRHADPQAAEQITLGMAAQLRERIAAEHRVETELIGPAPCFFSQVDGIYRWQVVLRGPEPGALVRNLRRLDGWRIETQPVTLL